MGKRMQGTTIGLTAACAAFCLLAALPGPTAYGATQSGVAVISRVAFGGTAASPTITITGSKFGTRPKANPKISPAKAGAKYHSACYRQTLQGNGNDGSDYGQKALGIGWGTSTPSGYSAGVYVSGSYLDCIGLILQSYTPTRIVLHLGCQYPLYSQIVNGDRFVVQVRGVTKSGTVAARGKDFNVREADDPVQRAVTATIPAWRPSLGSGSRGSGGRHRTPLTRKSL